MTNRNNKIDRHRAMLRNSPPAAPKPPMFPAPTPYQHGRILASVGYDFDTALDIHLRLPDADADRMQDGYEDYERGKEP